MINLRLGAKLAALFATTLLTTSCGGNSPKDKLERRIGKLTDKIESYTEQATEKLTEKVDRELDRLSRKVDAMKERNTAAAEKHDKAKQFETTETSSKTASENRTTAKDIPALELPRTSADTPEELIPHLGYTLSYNYRHRIPNWVAWELTAAETQGTEPRASGFRPDPDVRGTQADDDDYRGSGWDRGHMAPAADMKWSRQAMRESFYLSNVCPQNQNNNRGDWKELEEKTRELAQRYGKVWIAAGPIVGKAQHGRIGQNRVTVPDMFYKVLLIRHNGKYEGIGFVFKNEAGSRHLGAYARTIDEVEMLSGIDFFPALPDSIEREVEQAMNLSTWKIH